MQITSIPLAYIASSVWNQVGAKYLTSLQNCVSALNLAQTTIAAGATVLITPTTGLLWDFMISIGAASAGAMKFGVYDGTNYITGGSAPANGGASIRGGASPPASFYMVNQDGAHAGAYGYSGWQWSIL